MSKASILKLTRQLIRTLATLISTFSQLVFAMAFLPIKHSENVWYFAYGSNMSTAKFTGSRGITPLSTARVRLPGWVLTMEIPGTPYSEPSFSSIRPRGCASDLSQVEVIGLAYLITQVQYHKVIASEGGGIAYNDISLRANPVYAEDEAKTGHSIQVRTLGTAMSRRPCGLPSTRYMVRKSPLRLQLNDMLVLLVNLDASRSSSMGLPLLIFVSGYHQDWRGRSKATNGLSATPQQCPPVSKTEWKSGGARCSHFPLLLGLGYVAHGDNHQIVPARRWKCVRPCDLACPYDGIYDVVQP